MLDTKMINVTVTGAPPNPNVGDIHIETSDDVIEIYVWNGSDWSLGGISLTGGSVFTAGDDSPATQQQPEQDTPEKAYDRAMGIVR